MNLGFSEMVFLFILGLLLFGPKRLPEIGRQVGRLMNELRRASNDFRSQIETEINSLDVNLKPQILPPLESPLNSLASRLFNPPPEKVDAPRPVSAPTPAPESPPAPKVAPDA
jgi:Tat protein translocase TatB subunit